MRYIYPAERGVTLLEMMLVLAISAAVLVMSIRQYEVFKIGSDAELVKANVDKIFQAASNYYFAQCQQNRPSTPDANALDPTISGPVVVSVQDLIDSGYMTDQIPGNPLVDDSAANTTNGYMVQFNRQNQTINVCTAGTATTPATTDPNAPSCSNTQSIGTAVNWQIQVSVIPRNPALLEQILNMTAADCKTSAQSGGAVANCLNAQQFAQQCTAAENVINTTTPGTPAYVNAVSTFAQLGCVTGPRGNIVSFQRNPSFSTAVDGQSGLWIANKTLQQTTKASQMGDTHTLLTTGQYFTCGN